jgi:hypothetical protein
MLVGQLALGEGRPCGPAGGVKVGQHLVGLDEVSKLEHGTRPPSRDDIRAWCLHCHADAQAPDLIAVARSVDAMYTEWRRKMRSGLKHFQDS